MSQYCISVVEMGKRLGVSRGYAYELASRKDFYPAFRLGQRILIRVDALEKWLAEQTA